MGGTASLPSVPAKQLKTLLSVTHCEQGNTAPMQPGEGAGRSVVGFRLSSVCLATPSWEPGLATRALQTAPRQPTLHRALIRAAGSRLRGGCLAEVRPDLLGAQSSCSTIAEVAPAPAARASPPSTHPAFAPVDAQSASSTSRPCTRTSSRWPTLATAAAAPLRRPAPSLTSPRRASCAPWAPRRVLRCSLSACSRAWTATGMAT